MRPAEPLGEARHSGDHRAITERARQSRESDRVRRARLAHAPPLRRRVTRLPDAEQGLNRAPTRASPKRRPDPPAERVLPTHIEAGRIGRAEDLRCEAPRRTVPRRSEGVVTARKRPWHRPDGMGGRGDSGRSASRQRPHPDLNACAGPRTYLRAREVVTAWPWFEGGRRCAGRRRARAEGGGHGRQAITGLWKLMGTLSDPSRSTGATTIAQETAGRRTTPEPTARLVRGQRASRARSCGGESASASASLRTADADPMAQSGKPQPFRGPGSWVPEMKVRRPGQGQRAPSREPPGLHGDRSGRPASGHETSVRPAWD